MQSTKKYNHINEIDTIRGVFILLMVAFHLVYIEQQYPYCKQIVYAFHMPSFLLISGYLMSIHKGIRHFTRTILLYALPYFLIESAYIAAASIVPIHEHIKVFTIEVFTKTLFTHPIGPYWYLQSLIIFGTTYFCIFSINRLSTLSRIILCGIIIHIISKHVVSCSLYYGLFFFSGVVLRQSKITFQQFFQPSFFSPLALLLLTINQTNLKSGTVAQIFIAYLSISTTLLFIKACGPFVNRQINFIGRNTLPIFLFSPIFTFACKALTPYFLFDPTGILYLVLSLTLCTAGSLFIANILDDTHLSTIFFTKPFFPKIPRKQAN